VLSGFTLKGCLPVVIVFELTSGLALYWSPRACAGSVCCETI